MSDQERLLFEIGKVLELSHYLVFLDLVTSLCIMFEFCLIKFISWDKLLLV